MTSRNLAGRLRRLQGRLPAPRPATVVDFEAAGEPPSVEDLGRLGAGGVMLVPTFANLAAWQAVALEPR